MNAPRKRHLWSLPPLGRAAQPAPAHPGHSLAAVSAEAASPAADVTRGARLHELHEDTYADLLRFVQRRLPGPEAEDVVASVFETAWTRLDDVPHDIQDARPWLFGVARNVMANHHRAAVRRSSLAVRLATTTATDADVHHDGHDEVGARLDLVRAWRTLADADQEVLSLVAFDGLGGAQAAEVLGISRSAFAMRLQRARQRLATALHTDTDTADSRSNTIDPASAPPSEPPGDASRPAPPAALPRRSAFPTPSTLPSPNQEMTWART